MRIILGIDLGTSSAKAMLLEAERGIIASASAEYTVEIPAAGYAQQSPDIWWNAVIQTLGKLGNKEPWAMRYIAAVGLSGQMHGLVAVDDTGAAVRPAIIWLDQRSKEQAEQIAAQVSESEMGEIFHNRVFTGYAFPSLLWVRDYEPDNYDRIASIMLPKDYIRMKLTGMIGTDASDASSSCLAVEKRREWAWDIIDRFHLRREIFPEIHEAWEIAGQVTDDCAKETGLPAGIPVVYGSGDQPAQGIGNGQIREGDVICNIGTGGQISTYSETDRYDPKLRLQTFCHAINRGYTIFGATLCAGMSLKWMKNQVLCMNGYEQMNRMASEIEPGCTGLIYLPYLCGERTPLMDPNVSGMFWGMKLCHDRRHLTRAVMEGVVYSLKDSLCILAENGVPASRVIASGGGANSPVWLQMQADIFELPVVTSVVREQAGLGACLIAGVGTGIFRSVEEACLRFTGFEHCVYEPDEKNRDRYRASYAQYRRISEAISSKTI